MKSWIHEISESYVEKRRPARKDLLEHYRKLDEQQKFDLMKYNMMVYLDEQIRNAYGVSLEELNEEQLDEFFGKLASMWAGVRQAGGRQVGKLVQGARNIGADIQAGRAEHEKWQAEKLAASAEELENKARRLEGLGAEPVKVRDVGPAPSTGAAGYRMGITQAAMERGLGKGKKIEGDINRLGYGGGFVGTEGKPAVAPEPDTKPTDTEREPVVGRKPGSKTTTAHGYTTWGAGASTPESESTFELGSAGTTPVPQTPPNLGPGAAPGAGATPTNRGGIRIMTPQYSLARKPETQDISIKGLPDQEFKTPKLPPGSVSLGREGKTVTTGGRFMSKAAVDAGAHLAQAAANIRKRRR
jgi:hypothetical protein